MCSIAFCISPASIMSPAIIASSNLRTISSPVAPAIVCGTMTHTSSTITVTSLSLAPLQS